MSRILTVFLACLCCVLAAAEGDAYRAVMAELSRHPNRLPGSPGYDAAFAVVERTLAGAGLKTDRITFGSAVPRTEELVLEVDGKPVPGVLALAPNGAAPPTTWGRELEGPLLWLGDGSYAEMAGKPIDGCIAALRSGSTAIPRVYAQGAQAVIIVDDPTCDQWAAAHMFHAGPVASPRVWMPQEQAVAAGIVGADGSRSAKLRVRQSWSEARASDLWCLLPATPGGNPDRAKQTIVLAATLATFGAVPELCPDGRLAANAALLTEMAVRLAAGKRDRNILVVFLGGSQHAQEGARVLYYVVRKSQAGSSDSDPLDRRQAWMEERTQAAARRAELLNSDAVISVGGDDGFALGLELRREITAEVNALNYRYRQVNLARGAAEAKAKGKDAGDAERAEAARLLAESTEIKAQVGRLNELRRQMRERRITDPTSFAALRGSLRDEFLAQVAWLRQNATDVASYRRLAEVLQGRQVMAHIGLDLAQADRPLLFNPFGLGLRILFGETADQLQPGHYAKHIAAYQRIFNAARAGGGADWPATLFVTDQAANYSFDTLCTPRLRSVPCVVPQAMGIMGSQLMTLGDSLDRDHLPLSPAPDLSRLAGELTGYARALTMAELPTKIGLQPSTFYDDKLVFRWEGERWKGLRVDRLAAGSEEVAGPATGAVLMVNGTSGLGSTWDATLSGSEGASTIVGPLGYVFCPGLRYDAEGRRMAIDLGSDGAPARFFDPGLGGTPFNIRLFTGFGGAVYTDFSPADYGISLPFKRLMARTDSQVKRAFGSSGRTGVMLVTNEERPLKVIGNGLLLLGSDAARPQGQGYASDPATELRLDAVRRSGEDLAQLNQKRLSVLRDKNLINRAVERLHADCGDHIDAARAARQANDVPLAAAHETMAAILAYRAYEPLNATANDLLRAVVILLILSIPFAFALERLVLGSVSIYRQIGGFVGIFAATFVVLYFTHPAFALASAPIIIFLAFVIILLSAFVISVVMGKFKHELKALQGLSAKSHSTGAEASTTMAAVVIGMAGMRNRPLKTFLTIATVTLLTFTILVFASFESGLGVVQTWLGRSRGEDRIELHQPTFLRIPERLAESVERLYGDRFEVVRRSAVFRDPRAPAGGADSGNTALAPASGQAMRLAAVLGVDPAESRRLKGLFPELGQSVGRVQPIYLSATAAGQLRVKPGDEVRVRGIAFRFAGAFAEEAVRSLERIDGSRLTPPDFDATLASANQSQQGTANSQQFDMAFSSIDITAFVYSSPALVAVTSNAGAAALEGFINGLVLYPRQGDVDIGAAAEELATRFNAPVYATGGEGARKYFFSRALQGSGYGDLVVPLLLGGLIIFSSLLGSIVDRQKEIFTYSALGLSPRDVGTLFFAESAVVAVVGGLGGYLIGQLVAKVLNVMGNYGLIEVPDFNFSSLSALVTILIVMAMVMLSTIYPALMASKSANPGVNRAWRMPKPDGDRLVFTFPFTVPEKSFGGIAAFIREHFQNHGDAALDVFAAKQVRLGRGEGGRLAIMSEVALAPFDLGVYQKFRMTTRASDIAGIDEVVVELERVNGSPSTWLRGNRAFVADLREQFLIWRSLPVETTEHYQAEAARVIALVEAEAKAPQDGDHV